MKLYRGIDIDKYRSMDSEIRMLKNYQIKSDGEIKNLYEDIDWHRKMGAEKSSQMQMMKEAF